MCDVVIVEARKHEANNITKHAEALFPWHMNVEDTLSSESVWVEAYEDCVVWESHSQLTHPCQLVFRIVCFVLMFIHFHNNKLPRCTLNEDIRPEIATFDRTVHHKTFHASVFVKVCAQKGGGCQLKHTAREGTWRRAQLASCDAVLQLLATRFTAHTNILHSSDGCVQSANLPPLGEPFGTVPGQVGTVQTSLRSYVNGAFWCMLFAPSCPWQFAEVTFVL